MKYDIESCKCELCGSSKAKVFWDKNDHKCLSLVIEDDEGNGVHNRNLICENCGLVYVEPRMTKESLDEFYATTYRTIYGSNIQMNMIAERNHAIKATEILFSEKIRRTFGATRFLDIGCSTGQLVGIFQQSMIQSNLAVKAMGVEANTEFSTLGKKQGLNIVNADLFQWDTKDKFDIVTMLNTLEHMYSPVKALERIHDLLDIGGYLLLSVPNIENTLITRNLDAFLSNAHLYNFSPQTIVLMLRKTGFEATRLFVVFEEIGEKIYILAKKAEPQVINFDEVDPMVDDRIKLAKLSQEIAVTKERIMGQEVNDGY